MKSLSFSRVAYRIKNDYEEKKHDCERFRKFVRSRVTNKKLFKAYEFEVVKQYFKELVQADFKNVKSIYAVKDKFIPTLNSFFGIDTEWQTYINGKNCADVGESHEIYLRI